MTAPNGRWVTTLQRYAEAVDRYRARIGRLDFAPPMDWMCEPGMIERNGLSITEHQHRTVASYLQLR